MRVQSIIFLAVVMSVCKWIEIGGAFLVVLPASAWIVLVWVRSLYNLVLRLTDIYPLFIVDLIRSSVPVGIQGGVPSEG